MKHPVKPKSEEFKHADGITEKDVPKDCALAVRANPGDIEKLYETPKELEDLKKEALARQYVLIVDRSGSMDTRDGSGTRFDSARNACEKLIEAMLRYDIDKTVPVFFFDHETTFCGELQSSSQVTGLFKEFKPRGSTRLASALDQAMDLYAGKQRNNFEMVPGTTFVVLLDGGADDEEAVFQVIDKYAGKNYIDNHTQIAISFVQIGDDRGATAFLKKLDDGGSPDICDTKKDDILKTPGGVDRLLYDAIFD